MIRVAIAGTGALAHHIADCIAQDTPHQFIILSRSSDPVLSGKGYQVHTVDYDDSSSLEYALTGVDTVISTIVGDPQLRLIEAAVAVGVRRFAPAEFEGPPAARGADLLDRGRSLALRRLRSLSQYMESTVFVCGIFYERFLPNGMYSQGLGVGSGLGGEGDYLMNVRTHQAQIPHDNSTNLPVSLCMTSAQDVARFIVRALDFPQWAEELRMCGDRLSVLDLVAQAEHVKGQPFERSWYGPNALHDHLAFARHVNDVGQQYRMQALVATLEGCYDFPDSPLNSMVDFAPMPFATWLQQVWAGE
ncbi:MAG: hypothetical protein M1833_001162 [Piccolia ochrophora]|nr:MAG: hypothetical protein M1833_001162 [Piccolia ochrophora]